MSAARISLALRKEVRERANECCEYCLLPEVQAFFPHEPDHIIATKHGGQSTIDNFALACFDCNRFKGSDIASIDPESGELIQLFNPRTQGWDEHFTIQNGLIIPRTAIGRVTVPSETELTEPGRSTGNTGKYRALPTCEEVNPKSWEPLKGIPRLRTPGWPSILLVLPFFPSTLNHEFVILS